MGGAVGWFVVALAGVAGAPPAERAKAQITYTVRMVEAQGVDWREGVFDRLKPVTHQGAATVWTVPREAARQLVDELSKNRDAANVQTAKVIALSGVPAGHPMPSQSPGCDSGSLEWTKSCHRDRARKRSRRLAHDHGRAQLDQGILVTARLRGHRDPGGPPRDSKSA